MWTHWRNRPGLRALARLGAVLGALAAGAANAQILAPDASGGPDGRRAGASAPALAASAAIAGDLSAAESAALEQVASRLRTAYDDFAQTIATRRSAAQAALTEEALTASLEAACRAKGAPETIAVTDGAQIICLRRIDDLIAAFAGPLRGSDADGAAPYDAALQALQAGRAALPAFLAQLGAAGAKAAHQGALREIEYLAAAKSRWEAGEAAWRQIVLDAAIDTHARAAREYALSLPQPEALPPGVSPAWARLLSLSPEAPAERRRELIAEIEAAVQSHWRDRSGHKDCSNRLDALARGLYVGERSAADMLFALMRFDTAARPDAPRAFAAELETALAPARVRLRDLDCDMASPAPAQHASAGAVGGSDALAALAGPDWGGARPDDLGLSEGAAPSRLAAAALAVGREAAICRKDDCLRRDCGWSGRALQALAGADARLAALDGAIEAAKSDYLLTLEAAHARGALALPELAAALDALAAETHIAHLGAALVEAARFAVAYRAVTWDYQGFPARPDETLQELLHALRPLRGGFAGADVYTAPIGGSASGASALMPSAKPMAGLLSPVPARDLIEIDALLTRLAQAIERAQGRRSVERKRQLLKAELASVDALQGTLRRTLPNWRPDALRARAEALGARATGPERAFRASPFFRDYADLLAHQLYAGDAAAAAREARKDLEDCLLGRCPLRAEAPALELELAAVAASLPAAPAWAAAIAHLDADLALHLRELSPAAPPAAQCVR